MAFADDVKIAYDNVLIEINGLSSEDLLKANTIGKWSARDVIIHMALWDGEALKAFAVWRTGHEYDWTYAEEYLKLNESWYEITKKLDVNQVIQMFNLTRNALISDIAGIPDNIWENRGGIPRWLSGILIEHNNWHLEKLQGYRKSLGK